MADITFERPDDNGRLDRLLAKVEPALRDSFTDAQRQALKAALRTGTWRRHPIDVRLSVPLPSSRIFVTIVAGREKRERRRRKAERIFHPLGTVGNVLLFGAATMVISVVILVAVLAYSAVLTR